jgi:hypothetical protein
MTFIQFLIDTPVVAFMLLLVLLVTVVPVAAALWSRKFGKPDKAEAVVKEPQGTRFMGTQMDLAILLVGLLLLLGIISWVVKTFF